MRANLGFLKSKSMSPTGTTDACFAQWCVARLRNCAHSKRSFVRRSNLFLAPRLSKVRATVALRNAGATMRSLSDTLDRLARLKPNPSSQARSAKLRPFHMSGTNPGNLSAKLFAPSGNPPHSPLVVVLHGCNQTSEGYDSCAGWSSLAEEFGFYVLYPQQQRANNPGLCFNWFWTDDIARDAGEAMSIKELITEVCALHAIDVSRVFVTGLSAGGAMANVMLATYPELFAGGAVIAGLPYGVATSMPEAFDRMRGHGMPGSDCLRDALRSSGKSVPEWPCISIWHGKADRTVSLANAQALVDQWMGVHRVGLHPDESVEEGRTDRKVWSSGGRNVISLRIISGMDHGTPVDSSTGRESAGPFMLDVGISSTSEIAHEWGITPSFERRRPGADNDTSPEAYSAAPGIKETIEAALRSAGLLK